MLYEHPEGGVDRTFQFHRVNFVSLLRRLRRRSWKCSGKTRFSYATGSAMFWMLNRSPSAVFKPEIYNVDVLDYVSGFFFFYYKKPSCSGNGKYFSILCQISI